MVIMCLIIISVLIITFCIIKSIRRSSENKKKYLESDYTKSKNSATLCLVDPTEDFYYIDLKHSDLKIKMYNHKYNSKDYLVIKSDGECTFGKDPSSFYLLSNDLNELEKYASEALEYITKNYNCYQIPPIEIKFINTNCHDLLDLYNNYGDHKAMIHLSYVRKIKLCNNTWYFEFGKNIREEFEISFYDSLVLDRSDQDRFDPERKRNFDDSILRKRLELQRLCNNQLENLAEQMGLINPKKKRRDITITNLNII